MFGEGQQYSKGKTQGNLKEILSGENPGNHLGGETCIQQAAQHTRRPQTTLLRERNDPPLWPNLHRVQLSLCVPSHLPHLNDSDNPPGDRSASSDSGWSQH